MGRSPLDVRILKDINKMLTILNKKMEKLISTKFYLLKFKAEVEENKKKTPGVI